MKKWILQMALTALLLFALFNVLYAANLGGKYTKGGTETDFTGKASLADAVEAVKAEITKLELTTGDLTDADWEWLKGDCAKSFVKLEELTIATTMNSVAEFKGYAYNTSFYEFPALKKLTIAKIKNFVEGVFKKSVAIEELTLPNVEKLGMGAIGYVADGAGSYMSLALQTLRMPSCKEIESGNFTESQANNFELLVLGPIPPKVGNDAPHWTDYISASLKLVNKDGSDLSAEELVKAQKAYLAKNNTDGKWYGLPFDGVESLKISISLHNYEQEPKKLYHGKLISLNPDPMAGQTVVLRAIPDVDYGAGSGGTGGGGAGGGNSTVKQQWQLDLQSVKIYKAKNGKKLEPEEVVPFDKGTMSFAMPNSDVIVEAKFVDNLIKVKFTSFEQPMERKGKKLEKEFEGNTMTNILNEVTKQMGQDGSINDPQYRTKVTDVEVTAGAFLAINYLQFAEQYNVTGQGFDNAYKNIQIFTVTDGVSSHDLHSNANNSTLHSNLREITLNKLSEIGNTQLAQLTRAEKIVLPHTNKFGYRALYGNESLKTLDATRLTFIENEALMGCKGLVAIKLPRLNSIMRRAFSGCTNLATLYLGEIPPTVANVDAFENCPVIRSVILVDNDGAPLQGEKLTKAFERYRNVSEDGNISDDLWYGWKIVSKTSYEIKIGTSEHGTVSVPERAVPDEMVTVSVTPFDGYTVKKLFYKEEGNTQEHEIPLSSYSFKMPAANIVISVEYETSTLIVKVNGTISGSGASLKDAVKAAGFSDGGEKELSDVKTLEVVSGTFSGSDWKSLSYFFAGTDKLESFVIADAVKVAPMPGGMTIKNKATLPEVIVAGPALKYIKIPQLKQITERAFLEAKALETIELPAVEEIGENVFESCENLTSVKIPNLKPDKIGKGAFMGCGALEAVTLPQLNEIVVNLFSGCKSLKSIPFANTLLSIGDGAFKGCVELTEVNAIAITYIGKNAFEGCTGLTMLALPEIETIAAEAFKGCTKLTTLSLPKLKTVGNSAFAGLTKLEHVNFPLLAKVSEQCFDACENLKTLSLPVCTELGNLALCKAKIDPDDESKNEYTGFEHIENLTFPMLETIGERALYGCKNLKKLTVPKLRQLNTNALERCEALTELALPELTIISEKSFANCKGLTSLQLPNLTKIESQAFFQCKNLVSIYAPKLSQIEDKAFEGCNAFADLTLGETVPNVEEDAKPFASKPAERVLKLEVEAAKFVTTRNNYITAQDDNPTDGKWYGWTVAEATPTKVIFKVMKGTVLLDGAKVVIRSKADGKEVSNNVTVDGVCNFALVAGNYTYEVTADGCKAIAATDFEVGSTEKTIEVTMEAMPVSKTKVIFSVKRDGTPLASAKVVVKEQLTAQEVFSGMTTATGTVESMLAVGTYSYEVTADGCKAIPATVFEVGSAEKTMEVTMEAMPVSKTKVIFSVKRDGTPLASAKVVVKAKTSGQEAANGTTNASGTVEFMLAAATYTYEVTADGCKPITATDFEVGSTEKTIDVTMEATTETPKTKVIFSVKKDGTPLASAKVIVKDKTSGQEAANGTTNASGTVEFMLAAATYTYEVTADGCKPIAATDFEVGSTEQTIDVTMEATTETPKTKVIFSVKKDGTPLASAKVIVKDKTSGQEAGNGTTNASGTVEFMLAAGTYTYEVTADGCKAIAATDFVVASTEQTIEVTMEAKTGVEDAVFATVVVAPNPFDSQLRISNGDVRGKYALYNTQGVEVAFGVLEGAETRINTVSFPVGMYLLRLTAENGAQKTFSVVKK